MNDYFKIDYTFVLALNRLLNCKLQHMIRNLAIYNISIFAKGVPFLFQAGWKGESSQLAWKKGTPFCKILLFKNSYFVVILHCNVVFS